MTQSFDAAMQAFAPDLPLGVGFSGGADSTALLLACHARWPGQVVALHVHHGLQAAADDFEAHCRAICDTLGVPLRSCRIDARPQAGQSPEDAARRARYQSFEALALDYQAQVAIKTIALAQHADDQAETLLLALSRGAGAPGLAAMPARWKRAGITWHRPLLRVAGHDVRGWLQARGATWVEDPTNADERYTRNRIRRQLLPVLDAVFPQFRDTFARSAAHAAQASELLHELAEHDLAAAGSPPRIKLLRSMTAARQANLLRHWLRTAHGATPSSAQLAELQSQIADCATRGHRIRMRVGSGFVVREADVLGWCNC